MGSRARAALTRLALGGWVLVLCGTAPCGAEDIDAPPDPTPPTEGCLAPHVLAPTFYEMLKADRFAGVREVIVASLSACTRQGQPVSCNDPAAQAPAMGVLLARFFKTLVEFASDPPELVDGTAPGDPGYCAPSEAEARQVNRLCIVRRALDRLILERTADGRIVLQQAFVDLQPLLADVLRYVDGGFPEVSGDRYGDLPVLRTVARRCGGDDLVDLVDALLAYLTPERAHTALRTLLRLLRNPDAERFLRNLDVEGGIGKDGFVALGRLLLDTVRSDAFDPAQIDQLMEDLVYPSVAQTYPDHDLEGDLRAAVGVLMEMLDPQRSPSIVAPLQGLLTCQADADPDDALLGMVYDLSIAAGSVDLDQLLETLDHLVDLDPEGSLTRAGRRLFADLAADEELRDALARTIDILLREENARRLVPALVEVLDSEVPEEVVAILDAILGGCRAQVGGP